MTIIITAAVLVWWKYYIRNLQ